MIKIFDNVLSDELVNIVENVITNPNFPWYLQKSTVMDDYSFDFEWQKNKDRFCDVLWMSHVFITNKKEISCEVNWPKFIFELVNAKLESKYKDILRCQTNLVFQEQLSKPTTPHKDSENKHDVMIYYVNESDGNTILYDDLGNIMQEVVPKKGRVLVFDGNLIHSATPPVQHKSRIVFNYNVN